MIRAYNQGKKKVIFLGAGRGQALLEYLIVAMALLGATVALSGLINAGGQGLMQSVGAQLSTSGGTADSLFR